MANVALHRYFQFLYARNKIDILKMFLKSHAVSLNIMIRITWLIFNLMMSKCAYVIFFVVDPCEKGVRVENKTKGIDFQA